MQLCISIMDLFWGWQLERLESERLPLSSLAQQPNLAYSYSRYFQSSNILVFMWLLSQFTFFSSYYIFQNWFLQEMYLSRPALASFSNSFFQTSSSVLALSSSSILDLHSEWVLSCFLFYWVSLWFSLSLSAILSLMSLLSASMLVRLLLSTFLSPLKLEISIYLDLLSIFSFSTSCLFFQFSWKRRLFYLLERERSFLSSLIVSSSRFFQFYYIQICYFRVSIQAWQIQSYFRYWFFIQSSLYAKGVCRLFQFLPVLESNLLALTYKCVPRVTVGYSVPDVWYC